MQRRVAGDLAWAAEVKPGQYLTVVPGLTGAAAIIPLDQPLLWWGSINDKRFDLHAGIDLPPQVKTGDRFTARYAYAVGRFGEPLDSTEFPRLLAALGLSGTPAYQVTPDIGKVVDTKLFLTAAADSANGFSAKFTKADLPVDGLTIKLTGVNNRWSAAVWERDKKILNRAGGRDGALWANIALDTDRDVFIGNLLTCDSPDLRLIFLDGDQKACQYQVHNPTDQPITATVKSHPRFDKIKPVQKTLTIPPGTTVDVTE
jgi:hypothetical protein